MTSAAAPVELGRGSAPAVIDELGGRGARPAAAPGELWRRPQPAATKAGVARVEISGVCVWRWCV